MMIEFILQKAVIDNDRRGKLNQMVVVTATVAIGSELC